MADPANDDLPSGERITGIFAARAGAVCISSYGNMGAIGVQANENGEKLTEKARGIFNGLEMDAWLEALFQAGDDETALQHMARDIRAASVSEAADALRKAGGADAAVVSSILLWRIEELPTAPAHAQSHRHALRLV